MSNPESSSREQEMSSAVEAAQTEAGILLNDAKAGNWLEVSASELEAKMSVAEDGLMGKGKIIDEILGKVVEAEEIYLAAKEKGEVPEDRIKMIEKVFWNNKAG